VDATPPSDLEIRPQTRPFTVTRTVRWGDCDPAGIIYTPRVLDYAMEILEAWYREVVGVPWLKLNRELSMGAPTVRVELDFLGAPAPDQDVVLDLLVEDLGRSSITFRVTGRDRAGKAYFRAKLISCFISQPAFKPISIPQEFRDRIQAYRADCNMKGGEDG
jgi:4-hydroxybenzoyl-CoA thioesterase